jgi:hypothetical protein
MQVAHEVLKKSYIVLLKIKVSFSLILLQLKISYSIYITYPHRGGKSQSAMGGCKRCGKPAIAQVSPFEKEWGSLAFL